MIIVDRKNILSAAIIFVLTFFDALKLSTSSPLGNDVQHQLMVCVYSIQLNQICGILH